VMYTNCQNGQTAQWTSRTGFRLESALPLGAIAFLSALELNSLSG
jgi:hypothetical protein